MLGTNIEPSDSDMFILQRRENANNVWLWHVFLQPRHVPSDFLWPQYNLLVSFFLPFSQCSLKFFMMESIEKELSHYMKLLNFCNAFQFPYRWQFISQYFKHYRRLKSTMIVLFESRNWFPCYNEVTEWYPIQLFGIKTWK